MTYGSIHLLIGVCGGWGEDRGFFQGEGQEKILLCKGGGHYMKNKNIGGMCFVNSPDQQKRLQYKMRKKMQKIIKH